MRIWFYTIVRGDFAVSGTWSDDGSIAEVKVKLTRTDGKGSPVEGGGKGTWSAPRRGEPHPRTYVLTPGSRHQSTDNAKARQKSKKINKSRFLQKAFEIGAQ